MFIFRLLNMDENFIQTSYTNFIYHRNEIIILFWSMKWNNHGANLNLILIAIFELIFQ